MAEIDHKWKDKYLVDNNILYPPIPKELGDFYAKLLYNIIYVDKPDGHFFSKLPDELFSDCVPSHISWINMDAPRYDSSYDIIYANPNIKAMLEFNKYNIGPNYKFFKSIEDITKFFNKTKHPIHRIINKRSTRFKEHLDFSQLKSWDNIPKTEYNTYVVMYYDVSKLNWIKNKIQLLNIKYNIPDSINMLSCVK